MAPGKDARTCCCAQEVRNHILWTRLSGIFIAIATLLAAWTLPAAAQDFRFSNIQVEGNQRVDTATVATYAGIARGETISGGELNEAIQRIRDSGLFETVDADPRGGTLVITVTEWPTINRINFEGNRRINDDDL